MKSHQSSLLSNLQSSFLCYQAIIINPKKLISEFIRRVCKVRTQDPENLIEEVKSLVSAWRFFAISSASSSTFSCLSFLFCCYKDLIKNGKLVNRRVFEELSFSRLIVVPLFFIDFVGVRKENERLTAIPSNSCLVTT